MTILLTGATGFIGSHLWVELLLRSYDVVGIDNLSNSKIEVCDAVKKITGKDLVFIEEDIRDLDSLSNLFAKYSITHVIHLAALKNVQESLLNKEEYFDVNVSGLKTLLTVMRANSCNKIIFSSSAAVYGDRAKSPISEYSKVSSANWYGETKLAAECLLSDEALKSPPIHSVSLRYFNVAGRHSSGLLGNNLIPVSHSLFDQIQKALISDQSVCIFGDDWDTSDGTCIRDYVHVCDIAKGHIDVLKLLDSEGGFTALNLGSGVGRSVKDVVSVFEGVIGRTLPIKVVGRRMGDVATSYADCSKAAELINWSPKKSLMDMCMDQVHSLPIPR